jgi:hypothetical protein
MKGNHRANPNANEQGGIGVKFYTIKLPKFLGGMVKALIGVFKKD